MQKFYKSEFVNLIDFIIQSIGEKQYMLDLKIKYNELTAEQFIELWETVGGDGPSLVQTRLAM